MSKHNYHFAVLVAIAAVVLVCSLQDLLERQTLYPYIPENYHFAIVEFAEEPGVEKYDANYKWASFINGLPLSKSKYNYQEDWLFRLSFAKTELDSQYIQVLIGKHSIEIDGSCYTLQRHSDLIWAAKHYWTSGLLL